MSLYQQCALVYPYFENPKMLELQLTHWNRYCGELAQSCWLILVDDCSEKHPAQPIFEQCNWKQKALFRVRKRMPWHQHGARNIGAFEAGKLMKNPWLFMSDIDIVLTPEMAAQMLNRKLDPKHTYTQERTFAPDFVDFKTHPNTMLTKYAAFWQVGGYDEDFCGTYGGDGAFMRQLTAICPEKHLDDVILIGYGRRQRDGEPVLADADTNEDRAAYSKKYQERFREKRNRGDMRSRNPLREAYERVSL